MATPRVYVACLAAYNSGILHGVWIDADQDADDIHSEVLEMLVSSPIPGAEEFAIYDNEHFPTGIVGEYTSLERVARIAEFLAEHDTPGAVALSYHCGDLDAATKMLDRFDGIYASLKEFGEERFFEYFEVPEPLRPYVDPELWADSLDNGGEIVTIEHNSNTFVFWN